jgi:hypothetical protein
VSVPTEVPHQWLKELNTVCAAYRVLGVFASPLLIQVLFIWPNHQPQVAQLVPHYTHTAPADIKAIMSDPPNVLAVEPLSPTVPPGPAASSSAPNVITYSYASRMVYVAPGETYDVRPIYI